MPFTCSPGGGSRGATPAKKQSEEQAPETIAAAVEEFLAAHPPAVVLLRCEVHPATEVVLRYLSPRVDWELVALDERWRKNVKAVWRKRSTDLARISQ